MAELPATPVNLSSPPRSRATGHKSRHVAKLSNVPFFGRSTWMSRIQQIASQAPPDSKYPRLLAFLEFWKWIGPYLHDFIHKNAAYQSYPAGKTGIFAIAAPPGEGTLRVALAGDWGTGTLEAETVADNMQACSPHYTLHLGDVYYMGQANEVDENCLGEATPNYTGVTWPKGSLGSFAVMGNHEMYSGGQGYYEEFLPHLGLLGGATVTDPQSASYFCLEADHWVVLGLDTGYHSGGVPLFVSIPLINRIACLNIDARFDPKMLVWLRKTFQTLEAKGSGSKPVLLLTHHQPVSSFDFAFQKPAQQLAGLGSLNGRQFVWLYGHEHRLTVYEEQTIAESLQVYPRCVGHSGMPVEVSTLKQPEPTIRYYDPRTHDIDAQDPKTRVGYNGHAVLLFEGPKLTIEYHDIVKNNLLLTETFTPDGSGALQYASTTPPDSPLRHG